MPTTTVRLPERLKQRVARAAERAGTTPHNFIVEAIAQKTEEDELRRDFEEVAERRYAGILASGKTVPWAEMRRHLQERLEKDTVRRPKRKPRTR